ncbi:MAG: Nif3-like dinuclear metal center hexameric protein [Gemmatimonadales bacterium]|nr:Nif3-like dinuclear metal center hexameric protein [Gemmatimonadales bacterium]
MSGAPRVPLAELAAYLDGYLRVREWPDEANALNGLQVENGGSVGRLVGAVDASLATIEGLAEARGVAAPALLLVHHGLFWDGNVPATGRRYQRLRALFAQDAALYSAHIPLDAHADVGNNAVLARDLHLTDVQPFGEYRGRLIGVAGTLPAELQPRDALLRRLATLLDLPAPPRCIPGGPDVVRRLAIVTGGASGKIREAREAGCEAFLTGEGPHHTYFDAMEWGVSVIYAGHYKTETVGVRALGVHLAERFGLPFAFHDHPTGL